MNTYAGSADISSPSLSPVNPGDETASPRASYDWKKDAFGCYEFWREWKGMELARSRIIELIKGRAGRG